MREFFLGWRRKVGCVLLVISLAATGMWIRSAYIKDIFVPPRWVGLNAALLSLEHSIVYKYFDTASSSSERLWASFLIDGSEINAPGHNWEWRFNGFGSMSNPGGSCLVVPYWGVAVPLTLLSAYLILRKPRKRDETPSTQVGAEPNE